MKQSLPKKSRTSYRCEQCDYETSDNRDYRRHLDTKKHNETTVKHEKPNYMCPTCSHVYASRTSLWRHKKTCNSSSVDETAGMGVGVSETVSETVISSTSAIALSSGDTMSDPIMISVSDDVKPTDNQPLPGQHIDPPDSIVGKDWTSLIMTLVKENKELRNVIIQQTEESHQMRKEMMELAKKPTNIVTNNNQRISVVNYLNTECKDAMTLSEFINSIQLTMDDMYYTREHGYVKGMCNVFMREIEGLKQSERPIHCTDQKRLKFFIKTREAWKRDDKHEHIQSAMTSITDKHLSLLNQWKLANPDWMKRDDLMDEYLLLTSRIIGGGKGEEFDKNQRAVMKQLGSATELDFDGNNSVISGGTLTSTSASGANYTPILLEDLDIDDA